ncbi:RloB family protein [Dokdonia genika]|uniref:RloB family protein n=1 Tax=Dokdonia genika TaxID=308113 RepID=A0ABV9LC84_9FLAO
MRTKRNTPKRKPRYAFIVEGECEFWYIQMLKRNERSLRVDLKPEIPQKKKLQDQFKKVIESSKEYDKVFWLLDFDVLIKESREVKKGAKTPIQSLKEYIQKISSKYDNVEVIINNPCIEFWILLHFERTGKFFNNCENAIKQLKKHLPDYEKTQKYYTKQNNDIYKKLKPHLDVAIGNSNRVNDFDFNNPENGTCQMHSIFETKPIKDGLEK